MITVNTLLLFYFWLPSLQIKVFVSESSQKPSDRYQEGLMKGMGEGCKTQIERNYKIKIVYTCPEIRIVTKRKTQQLCRTRCTGD